MKIRLPIALAAAALLSGCYVNLAAPAPQLAVQLDAATPKSQGVATCTGFLWAFATGDCSVSTAMRNGRITKVHHMDSEAKVILYGAFAEYTLVVHGE